MNKEFCGNLPFQSIKHIEVKIRAKEEKHLNLSGFYLSLRVERRWRLNIFADGAPSRTNANIEMSLKNAPIYFTLYFFI